MPLTIASSDLLKSLVTGVAGRLKYGGRRRPWTAGYKAQYRAVGAALVYGVNHPGSLANSKYVVLSGAGAAGSASAYAYAIPSGSVTLPTTADVTEANAYLDAIALYWTVGDEANPTYIPRVATGGADLAAGPFWRCTDASNISTVGGGSTGAFTDWTVNQRIAIIVPAAADIVKLIDVAAAAEGTISVMDFMCCSGSGKTSTVNLNRVFA